MRGDGANEDVDGDCPLLMRGALVMTMAMISPSGREVSPVGQLRQSPRLVPPRFRLVAAEFLPESLLMIFFQVKRLHIAEDEHRRPARGPTRQGGAPPPSWAGCGPLGELLALGIFYIF